MAYVYQVIGKAPTAGNNASYINNKTRRRFLPNLQNRRFRIESENCRVSLRVSNVNPRPISKKGIDEVLVDLHAHSGV